MSGNKEFNKEYSESSFWEKIKDYAGSAGMNVIEKALVLYYCLLDRDTPAWAKAVIIGALGYFIVPVDVIPDFVPVAGYSDDLGGLASALAMVAIHLKPEHKAAAQERLKIWFG
jgi:uncharacterized membrane protein YkvA (DUF1232 family)